MGVKDDKNDKNIDSNAQICSRNADRFEHWSPVEFDKDYSSRFRTNQWTGLERNKIHFFNFLPVIRAVKERYMKKTTIAKIPFGKRIENNIVKSLKMAGAKLKTSPDLDHNHKIDFVLKLKNQTTGIQFSLRQDDIKAKAAKSCALDVVPRFIYLSIAQEFFGRPDKRNGKDLYHYLNSIAESYSDKALSININHRGCQVQPL